MLLSTASIVLLVFFGTLAIVSLLAATGWLRGSSKVLFVLAVLSFLVGVGLALLAAQL
jgi:hypothetical protein